LRRARELDALVVIGNHEEGLLLGNTSETLDRVRQQLGAELPTWLNWLQALPVFIRRPGLIVVHAGIPPGKTPETSTRAELTRIREVDGRPWFESWTGPETVVFGHWAAMGKVDRPLAKGLDTGCVYGRSLTGLLWPEQEWVEVPAHRVWFDPEAMKPLW
jgi:diadenosine tetraphosphatase ApaH/serine/threonine PP2A family protein phosphatase